MKILFNCTTNIIGGGLKNSAFFIKMAIEDSTFDWHFAVCPQVYNLLEEWGLYLDDSKFKVFEHSPSKNIRSRKKLIELSLVLKIDLVYTMAGPAYVNFKCQHIQGISNGYITHADWESFRLRGNFIKTLKYYMHVGFQFYYTLKATYFVFQTQNAKNTFKKRSKLDEKKLFVVANAFDLGLRDYFKNKGTQFQIDKSEISIFCPGAGHTHKGFQFIPKIASELKKISQKKFKFILTLPLDSILWNSIEEESLRLGVSSYIFNFGPYKYTDLKNLLHESNIVFVPSLLETFSASYLEAMCAKKKLVVADKSFSREVCRDYATYINPKEAKNTAKIFSKLFCDYIISKEELQKADTILDNYGNQEYRFIKIKELIKNLTAK